MRLPALVWLLLAAASAAPAAPIEIRMTGGGFQVAGWRPAAEPPEGWRSVLSVFAGAGRIPEDAPPVLGSYAVTDGVLVFRPRWPIAAGMHVRAVFQPSGLPPVTAEFETPKSPASAVTRIEHVYPSADTLPANTLRLYIYFSGPMRRGEAWQHIQLLDERGAPVDLPFLELDQELWDPSNTRLTVLFDPGRIKRGLLPLTESGPNLVEGRRYTLTISRDWLDAAGSPLAAAFAKSFRVVADQREAVDPAQWRIAAPAAGTRDPVVATFPRPLDFALLGRTITVDGVSGQAAVAHDEGEWRFTPDAPWTAGPHRLVIDTALEDVAGNRVGRPFDVDTFREVTREIRTQTVSLPFAIGGQ